MSAKILPKEVVTMRRHTFSQHVRWTVLKRYAGKLQRRLWKQEVRREEGYVHA